MERGSVNSRRALALSSDREPIRVVLAYHKVGVETACRKRVPGIGGSEGGPAKHWATSIQFLATAPKVLRFVSFIWRVWVTTWQKSEANPSI